MEAIKGWNRGEMEMTHGLRNGRGRLSTRTHQTWVVGDETGIAKQNWSKKELAKKD